jgi:DNA-binding transcriptional regulator YiaG
MASNMAWNTLTCQPAPPKDMGASAISSKDLQRALVLLNMVQEEFASKLGVRHSTVSRWLGGRTAVPGYVEAWLRAAHPEVLEEIRK